MLDIQQVDWKPSRRRDIFLTMGADLSDYGLEIGAANNPILRSSRCKYADYADTETLKSRFSSADYHGAEHIVDVDYVWSGAGSLKPIVGAQNFGYVIASHVIEHVPNPLGWFRGISDVVRPGGVFNLAIPDMRFTFDIACPPSSLGELVEADLLNYDKPSPRQIFDSCYYGKAVDPGEPWLRHVDVESTPSYSGGLAARLAYDQAYRSMDGDYYDSHCWAFTPKTFLKLLRGACDLELFDYLLGDYHPTIEGEFEFFLNLYKPNDPLSREDLRSRQIQKIDYFLLAIEERDRKLRLLAEK